MALKAVIGHHPYSIRRCDGGVVMGNYCIVSGSAEVIFSRRTICSQEKGIWYATAQVISVDQIVISVGSIAGTLGRRGYRYGTRRRGHWVIYRDCFGWNRNVPFAEWKNNDY